jgi:2',3'-cyclic-nucleotide 2'-phosphodiesterase (5'-nucleotidase family)
MMSAACSTSYKTIDFTYQNHQINTLTDSVKDSSFTGILSPYTTKLGDELSEIISFSDTSLVAYRPESPLSNFVSDLVFDFAKDFALKMEPSFKIDFSLVNHGGLRTSLPKGKITTGDIFELMPFENELVILKLTGKQVSELVNFITTRGGEGVSGISFGMHSGKAEAVMVQNKPLDPESTYWMVTSDYIANGGDGMKILSYADQRIMTGAKIRDVIINHLRELKLEGKTVSAKSDGRIYNVE